MTESGPSCAKCPFHWSDKLCNHPDGKSIDDCPTTNDPALLKESNALYQEPQTLTFAQNASVQEAACYQRLDDGSVKPTKPRILEIAEFAAKMGYQRLGFIFCEGLADEARVLNKFYADKGFEMVSVVCKAGRTPKEEIGLDEDQKIQPGSFEPMCNPIFQAQTVNQAKVDFNILMGLCVGHDSLVLKHLDAPVTVLAVKDRVTGHNPLAAVYNLNSHYAFLKQAD